jgi:dolichol kinase
MAALFFYPEPAAALAIYALAFGDSFSSVFGKLFGRIKIPFTGGKSVVGSIACFTAVFLITYLVVPEIKGALLIAGGAMVLEALPLKDLDNVIIPVGTGFFAYVIYLL